MPDIELIAGAKRMRRLDARAVHVHLAAIDRLGGAAARLEEAGRPKPFIAAQGFELARQISTAEFSFSDSTSMVGS